LPILFATEFNSMNDNILLSKSNYLRNYTLVDTLFNVNASLESVQKAKCLSKISDAIKLSQGNHVD